LSNLKIGFHLFTRSLSDNSLNLSDLLRCSVAIRINAFSNPWGFSDSLFMGFMASNSLLGLYSV
jgi:hypothetical protein